MSYTDSLQELLDLTDYVRIHKNCKDIHDRYRFSVVVDAREDDKESGGDDQFFHAPSIEEAVRQAIDYLKGE